MSYCLLDLCPNTGMKILHCIEVFFFLYSDFQKKDLVVLVWCQLPRFPLQDSLASAKQDDKVFADIFANEKMSSKMTKPSSVCEISVEKRWNKLISKSATRRNTPPLEELARNQRYLWLQEDFIISRLHINQAAFGLPTYVYRSIWSFEKRASCFSLSTPHHLSAFHHSPTNLLVIRYQLRRKMPDYLW